MKKKTTKSNKGRDQQATSQPLPTGNVENGSSEVGRLYRFQRFECFDILPNRTFNAVQEQINLLIAVYTNVAERLQKRIQHAESHVPVNNVKKLLAHSQQRIKQLRAHATAPVKEYSIGEIELFGLAAERVAIDFPIPPFIALVNSAYYEILSGIMQSGQTDADGYEHGLRYWFPYNTCNQEQILLDLWFVEFYSANDEARYDDGLTRDIFHQSYLEALNGYVVEFSKYITWGDGGEWVYRPLEGASEIAKTKS